MFYFIQSWVKGASNSGVDCNSKHSVIVCVCYISVAAISYVTARSKLKMVLSGS